MYTPSAARKRSVDLPPLTPLTPSSIGRADTIADIQDERTSTILDDMIADIQAGTLSDPHIACRQLADIAAGYRAAAREAGRAAGTTRVALEQRDQAQMHVRTLRASQATASRVHPSDVPLPALRDEVARLAGQLSQEAARAARSGMAGLAEPGRLRDADFGNDSEKRTYLIEQKMVIQSQLIALLQRRLALTEAADGADKLVEMCGSISNAASRIQDLTDEVEKLRLREQRFSTDALLTRTPGIPARLTPALTASTGTAPAPALPALPAEAPAAPAPGALDDVSLRIMLAAVQNELAYARETIESAALAPAPSPPAPALTDEGLRSVCERVFSYYNESNAVNKAVSSYYVEHPDVAQSDAALVAAAATADAPGPWAPVPDLTRSVGAEEVVEVGELTAYNGVCDDESGSEMEIYARSLSNELNLSPGSTSGLQGVPLLSAHPPTSPSAPPLPILSHVIAIQTVLAEDVLALRTSVDACTQFMQSAHEVRTLLTEAAGPGRSQSFNWKTRCINTLIGQLAQVLTHVRHLHRTLSLRTHTIGMQQQIIDSLLKRKATLERLAVRFNAELAGVVAERNQLTGSLANATELSKRLVGLAGGLTGLLAGGKVATITADRALAALGDASSAKALANDAVDSALIHRMLEAACSTVPSIGVDDGASVTILRALASVGADQETVSLMRQTSAREAFVAPVTAVLRDELSAGCNDVAVLCGRLKTAVEGYAARPRHSVGCTALAENEEKAVQTDGDAKTRK